MVKLNIAYPEYRSQKIIEIDDEKKVRFFYDKRISEEVAADPLGDVFQGYVFKITGGFDKEGFPMKQGVLLNHRTRLLLDGSSGHYHPSRDGERRRKSVRGCIIGADMSCINLVIVKRGPADIEKLTDKASDKPSTRGPKRANHIRAVWGLDKKEDVRKFVVRRKISGKNGKPDFYKAPKIQRLITPESRSRKRRLLNLKKKRFEKQTQEAAEYQKLIAQRRAAQRASLLSKKRETKSERKSTTKTESAEKTATKAQKPVTEKKVTKVAKAKPAAQPATTETKAPAKSQTTKPANKAAAAKPAATKAKPSTDKKVLKKPAGGVKKATKTSAKPQAKKVATKK